MFCFRIADLLLEDLSYAIKNLTNLKYLNIEDVGCSLDFIGTLTNLEHLVLSGHSRIVSLQDSIGGLKNLHTLDISWCEHLKSLPNSIGNLNKLHTLDLSGCRNLKSLPECIIENTILKSLLIKGCSDELIELVNSKLRYSVTLPLFKVRVDVVSACSNLPLLEGTNVGELIIHSLENVWSLEEARKIKLLDKDKLSRLEMSWASLNADRFVGDEDLLGQLVPPRGLKSLRMNGYSDKRFPSWFLDISHHLPNLVSITFFDMHKCNNLPPLGQLPNLEELYLGDFNSITKIDRDFCGGKGAFRRLSRLTMARMEALEEWCTTYSVEDGVEQFMFPVLDELSIGACPRLRLTPCPPICRTTTVDESDEVISSLEDLGNDNIGHLASSTPTTTLRVEACYSNSLSLFHHFTALQNLQFVSCYELMSLPESMRHLKSLRSLGLFKCSELYAVPDWLGDLSSLERLIIHCCRGIKSLPPCIQNLPKLETLSIKDGTKLKRWCESEENKKKLAHINSIIYED